MNNTDFGLPVRTSSAGWLVTLAHAYRSKTSIVLLDDAGLGIDPINQTLLEMGQKANLAVREWMAVAVSLGLSALGGYLLVMAILDPEPFSKIAAALAAGGILAGTGVLTAVRVLVGHKPPNIKLTPAGGFEIRFE